MYAVDEIDSEIILRPFRDSDAYRIVKWVKNKKEMSQVFADHLTKYPPIGEDLLLYYKKQITDYPNTVFLTACNKSYKPIGHLFISVASNNTDYARLRFVIVAPDYRGQGLGSKMVRMTCQYACEYLQISTLALGVMADNQIAKQSYESVGFVTKEVKQRSVRGRQIECIEMEWHSQGGGH